MKQHEEFVGIEEVAKWLGVSVPFVRKARDRYALPFYKFGRTLRFKLSEIEQWAEQRKSAG